MKKKILAIIIVIILSTLTLCGCNNQTSIKTDDKQDLNKNKFIDQNIGEKEIFSINNSGGDFSLFDDKVKINVKSGSVDENIDITIETISNPVQDSDIVMLSCYDFGPDGTTFNRPIDLIIRFNPEDLAEGVTEKDVKIYVLKNNDWEEIEGSFGNSAMDWSVASVTHFSKMGAGFYAPQEDDSNSESDDNDQNDDEENSALYWFKPTIDVVQVNHRWPTCATCNEGEDDQTVYKVYAVIWWDPVSYVHYYEMKFEFNGNPPGEFCPSCEFRDWGKSWCQLSEPSYFPMQGYIFRLGGDPNIEGWIGDFDDHGKIGCECLDDGETKEEIFGRKWPEGKHGYLFFAIRDTVLDLEGLSTYEKANLESEMYTFVMDYIDKWEIWIRGVTETKI